MVVLEVPNPSDLQRPTDGDATSSRDVAVVEDAEADVIDGWMSGETGSWMSEADGCDGS